MAKETKIAWANGTFNPWRGCTKVSEACRHCYAEGWAKRTGKNIWGVDAAREHASEAYWKMPISWNREAAANGKPFRVFCSSLADVCEDRSDLLAPRARLMRLIEATPALTWLLCTKRPENFGPFFGRRWDTGGWPTNVWALTTAEDQANADKRIPELLQVPAIVRGVSYEPALGPIDFAPYLLRQIDGGPHDGKLTRGVHWVIAGGESGGGARPFDLAWARDARDACRAVGAAFFMKQLGAMPMTDNANLWDFPEHVRAIAYGDTAAGARYKLNDAKGDDAAEWPEELRVQEFPGLAVTA